MGLKFKLPGIYIIYHFIPYTRGLKKLAGVKLPHLFFFFSVVSLFVTCCGVLRTSIISTRHLTSIEFQPARQPFFCRTAPSFSRRRWPWPKRMVKFGLQVGFWKFQKKMSLLVKHNLFPIPLRAGFMGMSLFNRHLVDSY